MRYEDLPRDPKTGEVLPFEAVFPIEYQLATPLQANGRELASLSLREPTVLDLEATSKESDNIAKTTRLLSSVAELALDDVRRLGTRDYSRLSELLAAFL